MKALSRSALLILVQSTLLALPICAMQMVRIPLTTVHALDRICRNFFRGSTREKRVVHTLAWHKLCRPKEPGGLGILKLRHTNTTLIANLIWKMVSRATKYGGRKSIVKGSQVHNYSYIWRSILSSTNWFQRGLQWEVKDGTSAQFWLDPWLFKEPLLNFALC